MAQINKPNTYFNTVLYTGNATDNHTITGVNFQPDWVWLKARNQPDYHYSMDSVRGALKPLFQNDTSAEANFSDSLKSFDTDGFTLGTSGDLNASSQTMASWNWLAGGTGVSNTQGSITSTVSANTTSGFSIVSYTGNGTSGATIGHGLGVAPKMIITKQRNDAGNWFVYHNKLPVTEYIILNSTVASQNDNEIIYNDTIPSSTTFTVGNYSQINGSSNTFVSYCFAEVKGFSKFGSYVGNGGNQFIYTGFKPAFVIEKRISNASEWDLYDNKRNTFNSVTKVLKPNASDAEATYGGLNFLSNGFEAKGSLNDSGQTLIYMAFAENPLVTSGGTPTTAR